MSRQTQPFSQSTIRENGWKGSVVIDAEDTDVYVQAAYVSQKVSGKLLIKKKTYMLIAELCLPLQWLMLLYSYML